MKLRKCFLAFAFMLAFVATLLSRSSTEPAAVPERPHPTINRPTRYDVSPPLRNVPPLQLTKKTGIFREVLTQRLPKGGPKSGFVDPVRQTAAGGLSMPSASSFDGLANVDNVLPADTNGDIGPNHYIQWVNVSFAIYNRSGTLLYGPAHGSTLWSGFGGACETRNDGDPIVLYDHLADRWFMSQLAFPNGAGSGPYYQCIAVSQTGDPLGSWHRYAFVISDSKLNDYPKFGVGPDGYYMTINQFTCDLFCQFGITGFSWAGQAVVAFERDKILIGDPNAQMLYIDLFSTDPNLGGMLPADLDGPPPPSGTPVPFIQVDDDAWGNWGDRLQIWQFLVNWNNPPSSTFTKVTDLAPAPFDANMCSYARNCIPQPGGINVDAISDRLMYRLQYRYFDSHESLVVNHTVDTDNTDHAGIRWYELRKNSGSWGIYQESTYAPDSDHRWMGSIAMDGDGNIALGYNVSSVNTFPSIRYTGRLASDPLGDMSQGESEIIAGTGYQNHSSGRWGDYSMMAVDPVDDCTFWYTQQYYDTLSAPNTAPWKTRIGFFKFPSCGLPPIPGISISDVSVIEGNSGTVVANFTVSLSPGFIDTVTVQYSTEDGTATTASNDYVQTSGTLTFAPGETSKTVTVDVNGDTATEPNETFFVNLTNATNAPIVDDQGVGTIISDDVPPTVTLSVDKTTLRENGLDNPATVTATLSAPYNQAVTVNLAFTGTATLASDYTRSSNSIFIPVGQTSGTITLNAVQDAVSDPSETIIVDIDTVTNGTESGAQRVTVTISEPAPGLTMSFDGLVRDRVRPDDTGLVPDGQMDGVFNVTLELGSGNRTINSLQLNRSGGGTWDTEVNGIWALGAADGLDATLLNASDSTVNFQVLDGNSFKVFASDDANLYFRSGSTFTLTATFAGGGTATASVTINAPSASLTMSFDGLVTDLVSPSDQGLTADGQLDGVFTVTLASGGTRKVNFLRLSRSGGGTWDTYANGSWILGAAFSVDGPLENSANGNVHFEVVQGGSFRIFAADGGNMFTSGTAFTLTTLFEDGGFATTNVTIGVTPPPTVTLSVNKTTLLEDGSDNPATVTAALSAISSQDVNVGLAFTGSATFNSDYTRSGTSISIPAGQITGTIFLDAVQDTTDEPDETIVVDIDTVTGATEVGTQQTVADGDHCSQRCCCQRERPGYRNIHDKPYR